MGGKCRAQGCHPHEMELPDSPCRGGKKKCCIPKPECENDGSERPGTCRSECEDDEVVTDTRTCGPKSLDKCCVPPLPSCGGVGCQGTCLDVEECGTGYVEVTECSCDGTAKCCFLVPT